MNAFGLATNTGTFVPTARAPLLAGRAKLRTFPEGPEGLLYTTIGSFAEAVAVGGLLIYAENAPNKWMIMVGRTLEQSISQKRLGKYAGWTNGVPFLKFVNRRSWDGLNANSSRRMLGGDFYPKFVDKPYFSTGDNIVLLGIVTSADDGYGHGAAAENLITYQPLIGGQLGVAPVSLSYLTTTLPMLTVFSTYLQDTKPAALALVPDNVRQYYDATFAAALAAFPARNDRPTITVPSYWRGTAAVSSYHARPTSTLQALGGSQLDSSFIANLIGQTEASMNVFESTSIFVGMRTRVHVKAGYYGIEGSCDRPFMSIYADNNEFTQGLAIQGRVGALRTGLIRDGHALERSVGRKLLYDTAPNTMTTLDQLVNNQLDRLNTDTRDAKTYTLTDVDLGATELARASGGDQVQKSVFEMGTLTKLLSAFSTHWDGYAQAAAKAAN